MTVRRPVRRWPGTRSPGKPVPRRFPNPKAPGYLQGAYMATFTGFAPREDPALSAIVVLNRPTPIFGGAVAAPVFSQVMTYALQRYGVPPTRNSPPSPQPPFRHPIVSARIRSDFTRTLGSSAQRGSSSQGPSRHKQVRPSPRGDRDGRSAQEFAQRGRRQLFRTRVARYDRPVGRAKRQEPVTARSRSDESADGPAARGGRRRPGASATSLRSM